MSLTRDNPGIEVRPNVVSYSTYFDTLPHPLADVQHAANAAAQR